MSVREQDEQLLIEVAITYHPDRKQIVTRMLFIKNPTTLKENWRASTNRQMAEAILAQQLRKPNADRRQLSSLGKSWSKGRLSRVQGLAGRAQAADRPGTGATLLPMEDGPQGKRVDT